MDVSVIILNWNELGHLKKCLKTIAGQKTSINYEVILIDNGSHDNSTDFVENSYPGIKLIKNRYNQGVAKARNQGIEAASGKYYLFLDVDTEMGPFVIDDMYWVMEANTDIGICGPKLVYPNGDFQYSCRRFPNIFTVLARGTFLGKYLETFDFYKKYLYSDYDLENSQLVDWILGAAMMIRKSAQDTVGLFDTHYFFGYEEIDYCFRAAKKNIKVLYFPHVSLCHVYRRKSQKNTKLKFKHIQSILRFFRKRALNN